jgi:hypothetical protein
MNNHKLVRFDKIDYLGPNPAQESVEFAHPHVADP